MREDLLLHQSCVGLKQSEERLHQLRQRHLLRSLQQIRQRKGDGGGCRGHNHRRTHKGRILGGNRWQIGLYGLPPAGHGEVQAGEETRNGDEEPVLLVKRRPILFVTAQHDSHEREDELETRRERKRRHRTNTLHCRGGG